jgi:plastocyanin
MTQRLSPIRALLCAAAAACTLTAGASGGAGTSASRIVIKNFAFKFDQPGTYHFICTLHPKMTGTIVVE